MADELWLNLRALEQNFQMKQSQSEQSG